MLSTEQRRKKLEALLERVERNRARLGPGAVLPPVRTEPSRPMGAELLTPAEPRRISEVAVAAAQPAVELIHQAPGGVEAPPAELSPTDTIRDPISRLPQATPVATPVDLGPEDEVADSFESAVEETLEGSSDTDGAPVVELTASEEVSSDAADDFDEEPEIEVTYGTREALALQAELGLGDEDSGAVRVRQESPAAAPAQDDTDRGVPIELDDLPAPAAPESLLDEPMAVATEAGPDQTEVPDAGPAAIAAAPDASLSGVEVEQADVISPVAAPMGESPSAPIRRPLQGAKTIVEHIPPEMSPEPEVAEPPEPEPVPEPVPEAAGEDSVGPEDQDKPTEVAALEALGDPSDMAPLVEAEGSEEDVLEIDTAEVEVPQVIRPKAAEPEAPPEPTALPEPVSYAAGDLPDEAGVADFIGEVEPARPATLGDLLRRALLVGKK